MRQIIPQRRPARQRPPQVEVPQFFLVVPKHSEHLRGFTCLPARILGVLSACGRFRRNGTPAPGLAASASAAPLGVCIYAVGGASCRIRARPEAVRPAGGGEIARACHVLALGWGVSPSSLPPGGTVRPPAPSAADPRRVASPRDTAPSPRSRLGASAANRPPAAALRSVFGLASPPRPEKRWRFPVRRPCALPPCGGSAWLACQPRGGGGRRVAHERTQRIVGRLGGSACRDAFRRGVGLVTPC